MRFKVKQVRLTRVALRWVVRLWLVMAVTCCPPDALAFCRTTSCELGEQLRSKKCARDEHGCASEGHTLRWATPCLPYSVQLDGSPKTGLEADQVQALVQEAFTTWQSARCPGGGTPRFRAQFQGYVSCSRRETVCGDASKNVNVIMLHDQGWPYGAGKLGVTTPAGGAESGFIFDADVELDSQFFTFSADDADGSKTALKYVLTHELGHFLGLDHTDVDGALMTAGYQSLAPGSALLSADDEAAICAAYPPGNAPACGDSAPAYDACQLAPGVQPPCKIASVSQDAGSSCSCRTAPRGRPFSSGFAFSTVALMVCVSWRKRTRRLKLRRDRGRCKIAVKAARSLLV